MRRMKKILYLFFCVALASCIHTKREKELAAQNDSLTTTLNQENTALNQAIQIIADIQEGFQVINEAEGRVVINSQGIEGTTDVQRIKEDLQFIQQKMAENRKQIEDLQKKLDANNKDAANLYKVLANLKEELNEKVASIVALRVELEEKSIRIAELDSAVVMLTDDVNTLHRITDEQQEIITQQATQLNTAWYVYGTVKELKEQNIYS